MNLRPPQSAGQIGHVYREMWKTLAVNQTMLCQLSSQRRAAQVAPRIEIAPRLDQRHRG